MVPYGNEKHMVSAAMLHGAHFASVQDGRGAGYQILENEQRQIGQKTRVGTGLTTTHLVSAQRTVMISCVPLSVPKIVQQQRVECIKSNNVCTRPEGRWG